MQPSYIPEHRRDRRGRARARTPPGGDLGVQGDETGNP